MHLAFSQQTASSYARLASRQYSVAKTKSKKTRSAAPNANILPLPVTSLYDILKDEFEGREGLLALQESGLTWKNVESIKQSVDSDKAQFEQKLKTTLTDAGINP